MSAIITIITLILVSPFMAISLLPALRKDIDDDDQSIVQWRK